MADIRAFVPDGYEVQKPGEMTRPLLFPIYLEFMGVVFKDMDKNPAFKAKINGKPVSERESMAAVTKLFTECRIILLDPELDDVDHESNPLDDKDDAPLDLPFEACFFEAPGKNYYLQVLDQRKSDTEGVIVLMDVQVAFVMVHELPTGGYSIFSFGKINNGTAWFHSYSDEEPTNHENLWLKKLVRIILKSMKTKVTAVERVNIKQKSRVNGQNIHHRIKEVIHCVQSKRNDLIRRVEEHSTIDWSHRWEVRGHWRKISGVLGKDRRGHYTVQGFTWVVPHEKGPENKPLVKKVRVFDGKENIV